MTTIDRSEVETLEARVKQTGSILGAFQRNPSGLVSDVIRTSPAYQTAKRDFQIAFAQLRAFNDAALCTRRSEREITG